MNQQQSLIVQLEDVIASGSSEKRVETLRRVTDLFLLGANQYSEQHVALFDDVLHLLADEMEVKARAELARSLAPVANAPIKVIKALASDDAIEVAGPVLAHSNRLEEQDLVASANAKSQLHLLAISNRQSLTEAVTEVLVARGDQQVVRSVAQNEGARFSDAGFGVLVKRSEGDDVLAGHVGLRRDLPRQHLSALIAKASDVVLARLAGANPETAREVKRIVGELARKAQSENAPRDYAAAQAEIRSLQLAGRLDDDRIRALAKSGKFEQVVVAISVLCRLPLDVIENALSLDQSDVLLIATRAAGLSWPTAKLILLLRTSGRGTSEQELDDAEYNFERLQPATARRVVRFHQVRQTATNS